MNVQKRAEQYEDWIATTRRADFNRIKFRILLPLQGKNQHFIQHLHRMSLYRKLSAAKIPLCVGNIEL